MQKGKLESSPQAVAVFTGTRARLLEGFETLRQYPKTRLLISGVNQENTIRHLMDVAGVRCCPKVENVTLDYQAQDTVENAIETAKWVKKYNVTHLCLVTSNYHMPRSLLELNHHAPYLNVTPHPVVAKSFQNGTWWRDKEVVSMVLEEYNKFLFAWLRYKIGSYLV